MSTKKAVLIQGRCLFFLRDLFQLENLNFAGFYNFVTKLGTEPFLYGCPVITLNPRLQPLGKALTKMGFKVVHVGDEKDPKTHRPADVEYLIKHLPKLDPKHVSEVVLLGWSFDLVEALLDHLEKIEKAHPKKRGSLGTIVATRTVSRDHPTLSRDTQDLLDDSADYLNFVEFSEHAERLGLRHDPSPAHEAAPAIVNGNGAQAPDEEEDARLRIVFALKDGAVLDTDIINEVLKIQQRHPDKLDIVSA